MKDNLLLTVMSLLSILLLSLHVSDDIVRGLDRWGPQNLTGVLIMAVLLYATLALSHRRAGVIIMLIGGLFAAGMPVLHMRGRMPKPDGALFFIWTLFALGAIGSSTMILAARRLGQRAGEK